MKDLKQYLDLTGYDNEVRRARRKGKNGTAEFFTPYEIIKKMCDKIPEEDWRDPHKTFCDPCCGNGQFILAIIYYRLSHGVSLEDTLKTTYAVELMQDNLEECKQRIFNMLDDMELDYDKDLSRTILDANLVCCDFFKWNFQEWREYSPEELKTIERDKNKAKKK
jgi:hypothetical protein